MDTGLIIKIFSFIMQAKGMLREHQSKSLKNWKTCKSSLKSKGEKNRFKRSQRWPCIIMALSFKALNDNCGDHDFNP